MLRFALAKQTTTRNIYKNIYLFSRRTLVWSRSNQERYSNRSSLRPGHFGVRRWPRKRTRGNDGTSLCEQRNFTAFHSKSSTLYYHQTPTQRYGHASSPTQSPPITGQRNMQLPPFLEWQVWSSSGGNNCHTVHRSPSSGTSLCDSTMGF